MMKRCLMLLLLSDLPLGLQTQSHAAGYDLYQVCSLNLGTALGQFRAVPVSLGPGTPRTFLAVYGEDSTVDPYDEMFFFPTNTLKFAVFDEQGKILWKYDLGRGVVPGMWFCPVFPFDLDGDGIDEIWFVNNPDADHPLGLSKYRLERLDARTGKSTGSWPWPVVNRDQQLSHTFRNFILGGHVQGKPVLVTAQGTYGPMALQGWDAGRSKRWEYTIAGDAPGARGSHMCPVVDINHDGSDELFWGERCISIDTGKELFCADRDTWRDHSDVIQPLLNRETNRWYIFTCREKGGGFPRVTLFDDTGQRVWGAVDRGHMDMGWVARLRAEGEPIALAVRIGGKTAGPQGFSRSGVEEFTFEAFSGKPVTLDFSVFQTIPVDVNGDAVHELIRLTDSGSELINGAGAHIVPLPGKPALAAKILDLPGEQIVTWAPDGAIALWADRNARDTEQALKRYQHPFYGANLKLTTTGSNSINLGGI